jgi:hypothetical protein
MVRCKHKKKILILFVLIANVLLNGCQADEPQLSSPLDLPGGSSQAIIRTPSLATDLPYAITGTAAFTQDTDSIVGSADSFATETAPPPTRTPAATLSNWRHAPVTPDQISERVLEIYHEGQLKGRDPHSFSVIGDCQSIPFVFMGPFGRGELEPGKADGHLWRVITTFNTSFKRWSVTSRGGFTAASILNPIQADPQLCKPGETPLSCEIRLNNPAYAFITLENWLDPDHVDRYEIYLRQIVAVVIENGIIPILITKADGSENKFGDHIINPMIVNIAYENELPLVNFYHSAQFLDNKGIDPEREGFHLSQHGYDLKNILALRGLYQVWQAVEGSQVAVENTPSPTPSAQPTQAGIDEVNLPNCAPHDCIFFGLAHSHDGEIINDGVYAYAVGEKQVNQILGTGYDLQDVKDDGHTLLVNHLEKLYVINLLDGSTQHISDSFNYLGKQGAYWSTGESEIIFLDNNTPLLTNFGQAFHLFPSANGDVVYFASGTCTSKDYCQQQAIYQRIIGGESLLVERFTKPVFSPDGRWVAFLNPEAAMAANFYHINYLLAQQTDIGINSRRILYLPHEKGFMVYTDVMDYAFSPNNNQLFILYDVYSEYYEHSLRIQTYLWDLDKSRLYDFDHIIE